MSTRLDDVRRGSRGVGVARRLLCIASSDEQEDTMIYGDRMGRRSMGHEVVGIGLALVCAAGCGDSDAGTAAATAAATVGSGGAAAGTGGSGGSPATTGNGGGGSSAWDCVGSVSWPTSSVDTIDLSYAFTDHPATTPIAGADVKACAKTSADCAAPLDQGATGADGVVSLTVPSKGVGFDGYFSFAAPGYPDQLIFLLPPLVASTAVGPTNVAAAAWWADAAKGLGVTLDPARGHVIVGTVGCDLESVTSGASISIVGASGSTTAYATDQGELSTAMKATGAFGAGVILNVEPGLVTAQTHVAGTQALIGTADILVRAGTYTTVFLAPTP